MKSSITNGSIRRVHKQVNLTLAIFAISPHKALLSATRAALLAASKPGTLARQLTNHFGDRLRIEGVAQ
jgi:hypothetical protein